MPTSLCKPEVQRFRIANTSPTPASMKSERTRLGRDRRYNYFVCSDCGSGFVYYRALVSGSAERVNNEVHAVHTILPVLLLLFLFPFVVIVGSCLHMLSGFKTNRSLNSGLHYAFSQDGIQTTGPTSQGLLRWDGLHRIEETRHAFLLFHDKKNAQVVPKRFFGESDLVALRALMKDHVAKVRLRS